ncbi:glycoside hydrolase family 140 protein [Pedobacter sp. Leaf170]|uniref:glycoside hydrolase family 140 protein n=1 Tax=Pedobacter sp. Leaf170 TaxID=2876558 RepID=UPI001E4C3445|nr:glycoside hydrolase family 140 protein [Pedobacter sp. Leaf170]
MMPKSKLYFLLLISLLAFGCKEKPHFGDKSLLVSDNGRFFSNGDGKPFFWLGDTGWLLFSRLNREETNTYLEDRKQKGFNVIQVMVLHDVAAKNIYGDSALVAKNVSIPVVTDKSDFKDSTAYDYWDHVDYAIDKAAEKGLYMALVPVWGTNVKEKKVNEAQAKAYAKFLADRYKDKWNIIWLNGGDIRGSDGLKVWNTIGETLRANDPNHLITFHPRGRTASSAWFHDSKWSDFDMVQSGHRRYNQDTSAKEKLHYGEDNWKYIEADYKLKPNKPTIDGEPSYEDIPQGLHDTREPRWNDADVRRYGYWSVFAGAFGYTYGHNSVMQMYKKTDLKPAYGPNDTWDIALNAKGATQMKFLKDLMLSRSYFDRVPDQTLVAGTNGEKYDRVLATRGEEYAMFYTYTGKTFSVQLGKTDGDDVTASWFDPRTGKTTVIGEFENKGIKEFNPPGDAANGNDWVLILDKV